MKSRFDRFQPITVRAAARLITLGVRGRLAPGEVGPYLRALAQTEPFARPGSYRSLRRLARRRSLFGRTGVYGGALRTADAPAGADFPECLRVHPEICR